MLKCKFYLKDELCSNEKTPRMFFGFGKRRCRFVGEFEKCPNYEEKKKKMRKKNNEIHGVSF